MMILSSKSVSQSGGSVGSCVWATRLRRAQTPSPQSKKRLAARAAVRVSFMFYFLPRFFWFLRMFVFARHPAARRDGLSQPTKLLSYRIAARSPDRHALPLPCPYPFHIMVTVHTYTSSSSPRQPFQFINQILRASAHTHTRTPARPKDPYAPCHECHALHRPTHTASTAAAPGDRPIPTAINQSIARPLLERVLEAAEQALGLGDALVHRLLGLVRRALG